MIRVFLLNSQKFDNEVNLSKINQFFGAEFEKNSNQNKEIFKYLTQINLVIYSYSRYSRTIFHTSS